jgi:hypothetical protein
MMQLIGQDISFSDANDWFQQILNYRQAYQTSQYVVPRGGIFLGK